MNKIIDFLQNYSESFNSQKYSIVKEKLSKSLEEIENKLGLKKNEEGKIIQLNTSPHTQKGQIWLCKQYYYDVFGNIISGNIPYLVLVASEVEKLADENFVRVLPITPFTDFFAEDEIWIKDDSITGYEFILETWNEQPILMDLLDEFVGNIDIENIKNNETVLSLSKAQKEFRKAEIRNTSYLRQSISSLNEFIEWQKEKSVFLNIENTIFFPKNPDELDMVGIAAEPQPAYLQVAKKGKLTDRETYIFKEYIGENEISIRVIKEEGKYILSVKQKVEVVLKDSNGCVLKQFTPNLYDKLVSGLYFLKIKGIEKEIRIRLK